MEVDSQESEPVTQANKSRKRAAPLSDNENEDDLIDQMLPAAAAMKRRKIEEQEEAKRNGISLETSFGKSQPTSEIVNRNKTKKEVNIQEVVRERREAEEEAAKRDEASLKETLDGLNVEDIKNLAVVEEMPLPDRVNQRLRPQVNGSSSNRWDEAWNGRKNFKKFRRRGEGTQARRGQSVIVPLEEVKKKDFGIGEEYWLKSDKSKKRSKDKQSTQNTHSQLYTTARSHNDEEEEEEEEEEHVPPALIVNDDRYPDTININAPRRTRHMDLIAHSQEDEEPSSGSGSKEIKQTVNKRPAPRLTREQARPPTKKQKLTDAVEESESEDELKFRFRKKG